MARKMKDSGIEWIGMIPDGWNVVKCKFITQFINGFAFDSNDFVNQYQYAVVRIGNIDEGTIKFDDMVGVNFNEGLEAYQIKKNDILLAMSGATVGKVGMFLDDRIAYINQRVGIIRSTNSRFLFYCLSTTTFIEYVLLGASGTAQPNISTKMFGEYKVCEPSASEQQRIANFLDAKCASIDGVIAKTNESIEEYKKLKQAVITEAVTKGVRGKRPMKDSGSVWFGKIPSDWNMVKFKHIIHIRKDIAGTEGYTVLSITQRGIIPKDLSKNEGQLASDYSNYQLVDVGDFAMNHMDLLTGWVDISKYNGVTSPDYRVFVLNDSRVSYAKYYLYLVQMCYMDRIFYSLGQGVSGFGRWRLPADQFLNFLVATPSFDEQREIADYLDSKCAAIDTLISKKQQFIDELTAYKKSLIYEYVTGKKEVPA